MINAQSSIAPEVVKYSTQLPPELVKWVKRQALEGDVNDYEVVQKALEQYRARVTQQMPEKVSLFTT